ncbi:MAG: immunoglobulin domain-containing protein [Verrucomicrobiota bacterium]
MLSAASATAQTNYAVTTFAGMAGVSGEIDGLGSAARFASPKAIACDAAGNVYVSQNWSTGLRKITPGGAVTTLTNYEHEVVGLTIDPAGNIFATHGSWNFIGRFSPTGSWVRLAGDVNSQAGSIDGVGTAARFHGPIGIARDAAGNIFVADAGGHTIRKILPNLSVTTLAGTAGVAQDLDGVGTAARFGTPTGIAVDRAGNLFVCDMSQHTVRKITPSGVVSTFAGTASSQGSVDGTGAQARFFRPRGLTIDGTDNLYLTDLGNHTIRKITPEGVVTTIAGTATVRGTTDGVGMQARFNDPNDLAIDAAGNIYVADYTNQTIRKVAPLTGGEGARITQHPAGTTVTAGQPLNLSVSAQLLSGSGTLTYQWRKDGVAVVGATAATFTRPAARMLDAGGYDVVVTGNLVPSTSQRAEVLIAPTRYPTGLQIDASFAPAFEATGGAIYAVHPSPDGGAIVGGEFRWINGVRQAKLARLSAAGTPDPSFVTGAGANGAVRAIVGLPDGRLLIAGEFTTYDNIARNRIARINADGSLDRTFITSGADATIYALAVTPTGEIYAVGEFLSLGGRSRPHVGRLLPTGAGDLAFNPGTGPDHDVLALAVQEDGAVLIAGLFNYVAGKPRGRVARLLTSGAVDDTFVPPWPLDFAINAIALQPGGKIVAGGYGSDFRVPSVFRLNEDGSRDATFTSPPMDLFTRPVIQTIISLADGSLFVGGSFGAYNGQPRNHVVKLLSDGTVDAHFAPPPAAGGSSAHTLAVDASGGGVWVGGSSSGTTSAMRHLLASGATDPDFTLDLRVSAAVSELIQQPDGRLLVGGNFAFINGTQRNRIARLLADGTLDLSFDPGAGLSGAPSAMILQPDGKILLGGEFSVVNNSPRANLVRLNADGTVDSSFSQVIPPNRAVWAMALQPDGRIIAGGPFTTVNGAPAKHLVRLETTGERDPNFDIGTGPEGWVHFLSVQPNGSIFVAGGFSTFSGATVGGLTRLLPSGARDTSFGPMTGLTSLYTLVRQPDEKLVIGGLFYSLNGVERRALARLHSDGTLDLSFPAKDVFSVGWVSEILLQADGGMILGQKAGTYVGPNSGIGRVLPTSVMDPSFVVYGLRNAHVERFIMLDDGRLLVAGDMFTDGTREQASLARLTYAQAPEIATQPQNAALVVGGTATFTVVATGTPAPTYRWQRRAAGSANFTTLSEGGAYSNVTSATLTINPTSGAMEGDEFRVVVTSVAGTVTSTAVTLAVPTIVAITAQSSSRSVGQGGRTVFEVTATGATPLAYQWKRNGTVLPGMTQSTLTLAAVSSAEAGDYTVTISNTYNTVVSTAARLTVLPNPLVYSTKTYADGASVTVYFSIEGTQSKKILLRALGPTLATLGIGGRPASNPALALFSAERTPLASNDDWGQGNATALAELATQLGATPLPANSKDAALSVTLPPGSYFAQVSALAQPGMVLVELFDAEVNPQSRIAYVAARSAEPQTMGVAIPSTAQKRLLARAVANRVSLEENVDPLLQLRTGLVVVSANDDWTPTPELSTASTHGGAFALLGGRPDAALLFSGELTAGAPAFDLWTRRSGAALLEVYDLPLTGSAAVAPLVVEAPGDRVLTVGSNALFPVLAIGTNITGYQWRKQGVPLAGATTATLELTDVSLANAGQYDLRITSALGAATSPTFHVHIPPPGTNVTHVATGPLIPGRPLTISTTIEYAGALSELGLAVQLPAGWSFASVGGAAVPTGAPIVGATGEIGFAWTTIPASPVVFTYTVQVPAGIAGSQVLRSLATFRDSSGNQFRTAPAPLVLSPASHSADTDGDFRIGLAELTRVIELYNVRNGTVRTGAYAMAGPGTEDGFVVDATRPPGMVSGPVRRHSADTRGAATGGAADGAIDVFELTRVIQLYNYRNGTLRTGQYRVEAGSEDGFAPGP